MGLSFGATLFCWEYIYVRLATSLALLAMTIIKYILLATAKTRQMNFRKKGTAQTEG